MPRDVGTSVGREQSAQRRILETQALSLEVRRQRRHVLGHVAVTVDYRMVESSVDLPRGGHGANLGARRVRLAGHGSPFPRTDPMGKPDAPWAKMGRWHMTW